METVWSRTADNLRRYGWTKGAYRGSNGRMCLIGGLAFTTGHRYQAVVAVVTGSTAAPPHVGHFLVSPESYVLYDRICEHLGLKNDHVRWHPSPFHPMSVTVWNDGSTEEDVFNLLQELHEKELAERGEL